MKIETLVSTEDKNFFQLLKRMNVCTDSLIIGSDFSERKHFEVYGFVKIRYYSKEKQKKSSARNEAVSKSDADICIFAEEGMIFEPDIALRIYDAYQQYKEEVLVFPVQRTGVNPQNYPPKTKKLGRMSIVRAASCLITFRRSAMLAAGVYFPEEGYAECQEAIFLERCLKQGLGIRFIPHMAGKGRDMEESDWLKESLVSKGALFGALYGIFSPVVIAQFAVRKRRFFREHFSVGNAARIMLESSRIYKKEQRRCTL